MSVLLTANMPSDCWNFEVQQKFGAKCREEALAAFSDGKTPSDQDPVWSCMATVLKNDYRKCEKEAAKGGKAPQRCVLQSAKQAADLFFLQAKSGRIVVAGELPGKGSGNLSR